MSMSNQLFVLLIFIISTKSSSKVKIVGGDEIDIHKVPYQVLVEREGSVCGGSIIDSRTILTAAHCTLEQDNIQIRAGSKYRDRGGQVIPVSDVYQHELYNKISQDFDISVLKLQDDLVFNENVKTVNLPHDDFEYYVGMPVSVSGWGLIQDDADDAENALRGVELRIKDTNYCKMIYGSIGQKITERMICAGSDGKDACQGDSGGPLVAENVLVGIVSWGSTCGDDKFPGVYSNVKNLAPWIKSKMYLASRSANKNNVQTDSNDWIMQAMIISNSTLAVLSFGLLCLIFCLWRKNCKLAKESRHRDLPLNERLSKRETLSPRRFSSRFADTIDDPREFQEFLNN